MKCQKVVKVVQNSKETTADVMGSGFPGEQDLAGAGY